MAKILYSFLIVAWMSPFMFGCSEEAPMTESSDSEQVDEATEVEAGKQSQKDVQ